MKTTPLLLFIPLLMTSGALAAGQDGQKNELFFVRYGYDGNANLREEQMFDSRTKELVRRFLYTYDAMGNRSKPVCITLVKSTKDIETHAVPTAPEKDPFADDFKKKNK